MGWVLVVEPDAPSRELVAARLRRAGWSVLKEAEAGWAMSLLGVEPLSAVVSAARPWDQPVGVLLDACQARGLPCALTRMDSDREVAHPAVFDIPGGLDDLVAWVEAQRRPEELEYYEDAGDDAHALSDRGTLEGWSFAQLYGRLVQRAFTGALLLEADGIEKVLELRAGAVVRIDGNAFDESLGRLLVRGGQISEAELDAALAQMRREGGPLGRALVRRGLVDEARLESALRAQRHTRFEALFAWSRGTYRLRPGQVEGEPWDRPPLALLVDGIRAQMSRDRIVRWLPPRSSVSADALEELRAAGIHVGPSLERLDGTEPLASLLEREDAFEVVSCLGALHALGRLQSIPARIPGVSPGLQEAVARRVDAELSRVRQDRARGRRRARTQPMTFEEGVRLRAEVERVAQRLEARSLYGVLGVEPGAEQEEIRSGYARARRELDPARVLGDDSHPDLLRLAERNHLEAVRALQILTDPRTRAAYDAWLEDPFQHRLPLWTDADAKGALRESDASLPIPATDDLELSAEAHYRGGLAEPGAAIEALKRLREEDPQSAWIALRHAQTLEHAGRTEEALAAYRALEALDPDHPEARAGQQRCAPVEKSFVQRLSAQARTLIPGSKADP